MGGWIEIYIYERQQKCRTVPLYMDGWIEITFTLLIVTSNKQSHSTWVGGFKSEAGRNNRTGAAVPLYMGGWIEIRFYFSDFRGWKSHSTWVGGLKYGKDCDRLRNRRSHSTWVGGLK